jgi:hypothetical protein
MRPPHEVVRRALRSPHADPSLDNAVEKLGSEGFDLLIAALGGGQLDPRERIRALRLLAHLCRLVCFSRRPELLLQALRLTSDEEEIVRDEAVHMALYQARRLDGFGVPVDGDVMGASLRAALSLGLSERTATEAREALRRLTPEE